MTEPREQKVVKVPVYWLIVGLLTMFASPIGSLLAAVQISEKNAARQLKAVEIAKVEAQAEARKATCAFFASSMDVYKENPPSTDAGRAQQQNYAVLYQITGCQPPRDK